MIGAYHPEWITGILARPPIDWTYTPTITAPPEAFQQRTYGDCNTSDKTKVIIIKDGYEIELEISVKKLCDVG